MALKDLQLDANNARKHSERNLEAIKESLKRFGQRKPIVVQGKKVLAGNGTLEAARQLQWEKIQVVTVPDDWDDDTAKAYALADNRTAELAEWDDAILAKQLLELQDAGIEIAELGFAQEAKASEAALADAFANAIEDKSEFEQITFTLHQSQMSDMRAALQASMDMGEFGDTGNPNKNGNAIMRIVELWMGDNVG